MIDKIRGMLKLWNLKKEALVEVHMENEGQPVLVKPGWKTTEFWVGAVLPQLPSIVGLFLGASNPITLGIGAACAIAYVFARSNHKSDVATAVVLAAAQAAAEAAKKIPTP